MDIPFPSQTMACWSIGREAHTGRRGSFGAADGGHQLDCDLEDEMTDPVRTGLSSASKQRSCLFLTCWRLFLGEGARKNAKRHLCRVNFEVSSLKPFPHLAFPHFSTLENTPKQPRTHLTNTSVG